jgi:putative DNA primase/helicase
MGKSVAVITDARLSRRTDQAAVVETLLSISGEDQKTIERKCLEPVSGVTLPTRFVILTNEAPRLSDSSGALASRLILLKFTESFFGREDPGLTEKLLPELPGILIWAIGGWARLQERGRFVQPASGAELVGDIHDLSSPTAAFVRDCCRVGPDYSVSVPDIYDEYKKWCEGHGKQKVEDSQMLGRNLRAVVPGIKDGPFTREHGKRIRHYIGIDLE